MKTTGWAVLGAVVLASVSPARAGEGLYEEQVRQTVESVKKSLKEALHDCPRCSPPYDGNRVEAVMCAWEPWRPADLDGGLAKFVYENAAIILLTPGVKSVCAAGSYGSRLSGHIIVHFDEKIGEEKVAAELARRVPGFKEYLDNYGVVFFGKE